MTDARIGHLVCIGNAHHSLTVFVQFHHLCDFGFGDRDNSFEHFRIQGLDAVQRAGDDVIEAGDDLGDRLNWGLSPTGVDALLSNQPEPVLELHPGSICGDSPRVTFRRRVLVRS